jgi:hypothetical protein
VAIAVVSLTLVVVSAAMDTYVKSAGKYVDAGENEDLRNLVRRTLDCRATVSRERARCTATRGAIQGFDAAGQPIVPNTRTGRAFQDKTLRLFCQEDPIAYSITATITQGTNRKELFQVPLTCRKCAGLGTTDPFTLSGSAHQVMEAVFNAARECGENVPRVEFRRAFGGSGGGNRWTDLGTPDLVTLTKICDLIGFTNYVASGCLDTERSGRYPSGKCNWHSPHNNDLQFFNGTSWVRVRGPDKYRWNWVTSITCSGRK